jgi:hypothetical protein
MRNPITIAKTGSDSTTPSDSPGTPDSVTDSTLSPDEVTDTTPTAD